MGKIKQKQQTKQGETILATSGIGFLALKMFVPCLYGLLQSNSTKEPSFFRATNVKREI